MHGQSLLHLAFINGVDINSQCHGAMAGNCPGCHVIIPEEWFHRLRASNPKEDKKLDYIEESRWNSRLACQIVLDKSLDGIVVGVGPIWNDISKYDFLLGIEVKNPKQEKLVYDVSKLSVKEHEAK